MAFDADGYRISAGRFDEENWQFEADEYVDDNDDDELLDDDDEDDEDLGLEECDPQRPTRPQLQAAIAIVIYCAFKDADEGGSYRAIDFLNGYARMLAKDHNAFSDQEIVDFVKSIGVTPKKGLVCPKCGAHHKS